MVVSKPDVMPPQPDMYFKRGGEAPSSKHATSVHISDRSSTILYDLRIVVHSAAAIVISWRVDVHSNRNEGYQCLCILHVPGASVV